MKINIKELMEKVDDLIKEDGKWLEEEGSVNIYEQEINDNDILIIQLHCTLGDDVYKPFFRVYSIENEDINYEEFTDDINKAIKLFNAALNNYVSI